MQANRAVSSAFLLFLVCSANGQPSAQPPQPEFVKEAQQLAREGKLNDALTVYKKELQTSPDSLPANTGAGVMLDLMNRGSEARKYFAKAIESAPTPDKKAAAERAMAMSYAFEGDCSNTLKYEQKALDYFVSTKNFEQQGDIANEAARVCIENGDLAAAYKWYKLGHDSALREPGIKPDAADLWEFRWEHAQARIAARTGNKAEARKHVSAAKAIFDKDAEMAQSQRAFLPYLTGYVAFYEGDYKTALSELQNANQNDPFIQCLTGQTYEKLGDKDKAMEWYLKAVKTTAHNPAGAYAHQVAGRVTEPRP